MAHDAIADAETAGLAKQDSPEIFYQVLSLCFDNQEAVCHESAENHAHLFAAGMRGLGEIALELVEGKRLRSSSC